MRWSVWALVIGWPLCACGPTVEVGGGEVCGQEGPVRVVEFGEGDREVHAAVRIGDRVYHSIVDRTESGPLGVPAPLQHARVVSTGLCGESPRHIADDVVVTFEDERWPGAVLAQRVDPEALPGFNDAGIAVLDPKGAASPRLFLHGFAGQDAKSDLGVVGQPLDPFEHEVSPISFQPYPATVEDAAPDLVELISAAPTGFGSVAAHGTEALALTLDGEIVRIDLTDLSQSTILEGVTEMLADPEARWIAFKTAAEPGAPAGVFPTFVLDRTTGVKTKVADATAGWLEPLTDELRLGLPDGGNASARIVRLPSLEAFDVPAGIELHPLYDARSDGRYVAIRGEEIVLLTLETGEVQHFLDGAGAISYGDDAADVIDIAIEDPVASHQATGTWWRVPYATGVPELVANRAALVHRTLPDGRAMTLVDIDESGRGTLVVIDPDSLEERTIDEDVDGLAITFAGASAFDPDIVEYTVRDGDRSGVWIAKPE